MKNSTVFWITFRMSIIVLLGFEFIDDLILFQKEHPKDFIASFITYAICTIIIIAYNDIEKDDWHYWTNWFCPFYWIFGIWHYLSKFIEIFNEFLDSRKDIV